MDQAKQILISYLFCQHGANSKKQYQAKCYLLRRDIVNKEIVSLFKDKGLTDENVKSHLRIKYNLSYLYLKFITYIKPRSK